MTHKKVMLWAQHITDTRVIIAAPSGATDEEIISFARNLDVDCYIPDESPLSGEFNQPTEVSICYDSDLDAYGADNVVVMPRKQTQATSNDPLENATQALDAWCTAEGIEPQSAD